jgi:methyl-accepting chemotaxis protein
VKIEKKLIFYIFLIPLIGTIIGILGSVYLLKDSISLSEQEGERFLQRRELELQKEKLKLIVHSVINNIIMLKTIKTEVLPNIKKLYPPKKDKYIFIYKIHNLKGGKNFATMLLNINRPDLEGKMLNSNYKDIKGIPFREKMLKLIRKNGEGFVKYHYKKPNSNKIVSKISYFKYYKPLNLVIASGVYLDDISHIIDEYKTNTSQ